MRKGIIAISLVALLIPVVATMADVETIRDGAILELPGQAVCLMALVADHDISVAVSALALIGPTRVRPTRLITSGPEVRNRFGSTATHNTVIITRYGDLRGGAECLPAM